MFNPLKRALGGSDRDDEAADRDEHDFTEMTEAEFWEYIVEENLENTDLTEEQLEEKPIWEIEEILDIDLSNVSMPRGNRGGFRVSDRKEVLTSEQKRERTDRVNRELGLD